MSGYAWVTSGGVYLVLEHRWCKVASFRTPSGVGVGAGGWETVWEISTARPDAPRFVATTLEAVRPGDYVKILGRDEWAMTTEVQTVMEVDLLTSDEADQQAAEVTLLAIGGSRAWIVSPSGTEELHGTGERQASDPPAPGVVQMWLRVNGALPFDRA